MGMRVKPSSQGQLAGVQIGWQIMTINDEVQPSDSIVINSAIESAKKCKKLINITFCKNKDEIKIQNTIENAITNITSSMQKGGLEYPISLVGTEYDSFIDRIK